jgi:hypothetical protein
MTRVWKGGAAALLAGLLLLAAGCGDEDPGGASISCSATQPVQVLGSWQGRDVSYTRSEERGNLAPETLVGNRAERHVVVNLGMIPVDPEDPEGEQQPLIISLQTNAQAPNSSPLAENLGRYLDQSDTLEVVDLDADSYCDVNSGEICAWIGLDTTGGRQLLNQEGGQIMKAIGGQVIVNRWTSTQVKLGWEVELEEGQMLRGCVDAALGLTSNGTQPLRVIGAP